jgi:uncharacterized protein (TIGR03086 family)
VDGLVSRHSRACARFSDVADGYRSELWSAPTPCTEWDARWHATADVLFTCLATGGALDQPTELPGGGHSSARQMLGALTTDVLVHTWDLARAGGVEPRLDHELCESAFEAATTTVLRRGDGMIGPELAVDPAADIETKLAALYGRDLAWRPPA